MKATKAITTLTCRFNKLFNFFSPVLLIYVNLYFKGRGSTQRSALSMDVEALLDELWIIRWIIVCKSLCTAAMQYLIHDSLHGCILLGIITFLIKMFCSS